MLKQIQSRAREGHPKEIADVSRPLLKQFSDSQTVCFFGSGRIKKSLIFFMF